MPWICTHTCRPHHKNRSTWVKPTIPASPNLQEDDLSENNLPSGNLTGGRGNGGGGGGGTKVSLLSAKPVEVTATGLVGPILHQTVEGGAACSSTTGPVGLREGAKEDTVGGGDGEQVGRADAATAAVEVAAVARSSCTWTPTENIGQEGGSSYPPEVDEGVTATAAGVQEAAKEREKRCPTAGNSSMTPSLVRPGGSDEHLEEPADDGLLATCVTRNNPAPAGSEEGEYGSLVFDDGGTPSLPPPRTRPPSSSAPFSSIDRGAAKPSTQPYQQKVGGIVGFSEVKGVHVVSETVSPRSPNSSSEKNNDGTLLRDRGKETEVAPAVESGYGEASRRLGSGHRQPGRREEEEDQGAEAYRESSVRHSDSSARPRTADKCSPRPGQARECSSASPAVDLSSPATSDTTASNLTLRRKRDSDHSGVLQVDPATALACKDHDNSETAAAAPTVTVPVSAGVGEEMMVTATAEVPMVEAAVSRPSSLSQEETMTAMAALIATLRTPPTEAGSISAPEEEPSNTQTAAAAALADPAAADRDVIAEQDEGESSGVDGGYQEAVLTVVDEGGNFATPDRASIADETGREVSVAMMEGERDGAGAGLQGESWETAGGMYEDDFED